MPNLLSQPYWIGATLRIGEKSGSHPHPLANVRLVVPTQKRVGTWAPTICALRSPAYRLRKERKRRTILAIKDREPVTFRTSILCLGICNGAVPGAEIHENLKAQSSCGFRRSHSS
jgi:hypothetical protein